MTTSLPDAFLLDGLRTPFGRYKGDLADLDSLDLGSQAIKALLERNPWASQPDAALMGVVVQAGLGQNPARIAAVRGGISMETPALTLNSVCIASLEAVCEASRRIRLGEGACYLVGGFDSMTRGAQLDPSEPGHDIKPISAVMHDGLSCALSGGSMGSISDRCNAELGISREDQDAWAAASQQRAFDAIEKTRLDEIAPVQAHGMTHVRDQGIRENTTAMSLSFLKPAFSDEGTITAGNASQMADGASAGLIVDSSTLKRFGQRPLARIVDWAWIAGPDASLHLKPAIAIRKLLLQQGLTPADVDLYEINEAFAGVSIASCRELGLSHEVVNVNGGAVALGHPLGATGFRLILTLALQMRRQGARRGIASLCGGGGQGFAMLIENCYSH